MSSRVLLQIGDPVFEKGKELADYIGNIVEQKACNDSRCKNLTISVGRDSNCEFMKVSFEIHGVDFKELEFGKIS